MPPLIRTNLGQCAGFCFYMRCISLWNVNTHSSPFYLLLRIVQVQHQVPLSCCATFGSLSSHLDLSALIHSSKLTDIMFRGKVWETIVLIIKITKLWLSLFSLACNVTIHNRCRDTLPHCSKMKQRVRLHLHHTSRCSFWEWRVIWHLSAYCVFICVSYSLTAAEDSPHAKQLFPAKRHSAL